MISRKVGSVVAGVTIAESVPQIVAGVRVIEAGVAFQRCLAAGVPCFAMGHREQRIAHGAAFAQRLPAAARAFEVAGGKVHALRDRAVDLVRVEAVDLRCCDRGTENAEHGAEWKPRDIIVGMNSAAMRSMTS